MNFVNRLQPLGLLVLRLALGTVMIAHGYQKMIGGMSHSTGMLSHIGIPPWMGYLMVAAEFGGGIFMVIGFLTRFAAIAIFIDMVVAISRYISRTACSLPMAALSFLWRVPQLRSR